MKLPGQLRSPDVLQYEIDGLVEDMGRDAIRMWLSIAAFAGIDVTHAPKRVGRNGNARYTIRLLKRWLYAHGLRRLR